MHLFRFPRRGYVREATPIEPLPRFSSALGGDIAIFIKRDDLLPGCGCGNKTRKLDFCIADALAKGADCLITYGAPQSNHCRLTLAWAVREGLACHLVLEEREGYGYAPEASGNVFLYDLLGAASITVVPPGDSVQQAMDDLAEQLRVKGNNPYSIPLGGSSPLGSLGYAACAQEIVQQLFAMNLDVHNIVLPSGSGGTQAGLLAGMRGTNTDIALTGISVIQNRAPQEALVRRLALETARLAGIEEDIPASAVVCPDDYIGPAYAVPTPGMKEAVTLLARTEAILLDPVYSGKAMAGLVDMVRKNAFPRGSNVLFLHTGGVPALYAERGIFLEER